MEVFGLVAVVLFTNVLTTQTCGSLTTGRRGLVRGDEPY